MRRRPPAPAPGEGDIAVAAQLFDAHAAALLGYLNKRVDADTAADLVADTFETVLGGATSHDPARGSERAWLFGIATNHLRHHLRSRTRERTALERTATRLGVAHRDADDERVADRLSAAALSAGLAREIEALAPADRDLLLLISWAQLTPSEAAAALGIPAGTARSRLHRTRQHLRASLGANELTGQEC